MRLSFHKIMTPVFELAVEKDSSDFKKLSDYERFFMRQ